MLGSGTVSDRRPKGMGRCLHNVSEVWSVWRGGISHWKIIKGVSIGVLLWEDSAFSTSKEGESSKETGVLGRVVIEPVDI